MTNWKRGCCSTWSASKSGSGSWTKSRARRAKKHVAQAYANDSARVFAKRAAQVGGELRIVADPPLITPIEDLIAPGSRSGRTRLR